MNRIMTLATAVLLGSPAVLTAQSMADYAVVPIPESIVYQQYEPFVLSDGTAIYAPGETEAGAFLSAWIRESVHMEVPVMTGVPGRKQNAIVLSVDDSLPSEGYRIEIGKNRLSVKGGSAAGLFYGIQTLRKSMPVGQVQSVEFPAAVIQDVPRFPYRGMMLDCARHFFSVDFVKEFIDILALHNMNRFHWHLTDDQGWRIEIKSHPELAEVGAWRSGTVIGNNSDVDDGIRYGGFYTQDEIRDIVQYAADRHVTVIPEIDMPGHALAILTAHPELGCTGGPYQVGHEWGIYRDVLCVGNENVYPLLQDILDEVMDLFPSEYIHIGGDETPTVRWDACPKCKALGVMSVQGYFTHRIEQYVESRGRRIIGWDEMLEKEVNPSVAIMGWRGAAAGIKAAQAGHDAILTPLTHCYFDYYQTDKPTYEPSITGMWPIDVEKVYSLDPLPDSLSLETKKHIIGVQANLWTEHVPVPNVAEYQILPRMAALSEVQWSSHPKDFAAFRKRLNRLIAIYDLYGWKYALHLWPDRMNNDRWNN